MSIIQEALRRKAEESDGASPLPSELPPLPPSAPGPSRKRKAFWEAVGVLVGVIAAGIVLVAAVRAGVRWALRDVQGTAETGLEPETFSEPVPESAEPDADEDAAAEASGDVPEPIVLIEPEFPDKRATPEPEPRVSEPPGLGIVEPYVSEITPPTPESVEPASGPIEWPRIRLVGVLASREGTGGSALFRDAPAGGVFEGESFRNVRVLQIRRDAVTVEYEGEQRVLRVGQSTDDDS